MNIKSLLVTALVVSLLFSSAALAVPISGLYNTGVDNLGNALVPAGVPDPHYSVIASPSGLFTPVTVDAANYPFPYWISNNAFSRWIGPAATYANGPAGNYTYRTTFSLPVNAILGSVSISGLWGTDDPGTDILINGASTSQTSLGFTTLTSFSITSGFVTGLNTIDFLLTNAGGPTGLRVDQIQGNYQVPEPTGLVTALAGALLMLRRRFRS